MGDEIAVTDNGNYIVDLHFEEPIKDARKMALDIKAVCGVVDHGLFCDMSTAVIIVGSGDDDGSAHVAEESVVDNSANSLDVEGHLSGILDWFFKVKINNVVSVVGDSDFVSH